MTRLSVVAVKKTPTDVINVHSWIDSLKRISLFLPCLTMLLRAYLGLVTENK